MTGYSALHEQLARHRGRAVEHACVDCGQPAAEWSLNRTASDTMPSRFGPFSLDHADYSPRCYACHRTHDQRSTCLAGLHPWPESATGNGPWKTCRECRRETNHAAYLRRVAARPVPEPDDDEWHPEVPC